MAEDFLSSLSGEIPSRQFITFDLESKDGKSQRPGFTRPFLVGWYDGVQYEHTKSLVREDENYWLPGGCVDLAMARILTGPHVGKIVYAHNAGRFDYLFLLPWLEGPGREAGFKYSVVPLQSAIQILEVWHKTDKKQKHKTTFLDTVRLLQMPLDKAAKTFGFEGKLKFDLANDEEHPGWPEYNAEDTIQLFKVMKRYHYYVEEVLKAEVKISTAGTAMSYFRRNHLSKVIPRERHTHDFVRAAYFGGRVEPFRKQGEGLKYYDINSSYPASMLLPVPSGPCTIWEGPVPDKLSSGKTGFIEACLDIPDCDIPPLPVRHEGKLMFPVGKLRGVWSAAELELAKDYVVRYGRSVWYESEPLLESFVRTLYTYRDKSMSEYNDGLAIIAKFLMNGLYGKFGMHTERLKLFFAEDGDIPEGAWPADGTPDSAIWYANETIDQPYIIPQIAATVTAYSRVMLYRWMARAKAAGGNIFYCDTDSIVTDVTMPTSTRLGDLKQEYGDNLTGKFIGPKMYALQETEHRLPDGFSGPQPDDHVRAKGFGKEHRTLEAINRLVEGQAIAYDHLEKIGALAQAGFSRGPQMVKKVKSLKTQIHKRVFDADGKSRPIVLKQW